MPAGVYLCVYSGGFWISYDFIKVTINYFTVLGHYKVLDIILYYRKEIGYERTIKKKAYLN